MELKERASYIKGLAEGLDLDKTTKEGKLIDALIGLCSDMAEEIATLEKTVDYLNDYVDEMDEDLGEVEELVFDDDDDEYEDDEDEMECDGKCASCMEDCEFAGDDDEFYEIECPSCGETVCFGSSVAETERICPACGEKIVCTAD